MATPSSMILRSLRLIGEKFIGDTLSSAEQTAYLADLNTMLESWSIDRLLVYQLLQESKALTSSVGSFTIGSGGTFNTTRPSKITDPCFIRDSSNLDSPVEIVDAQAYGRLVQKTVDGTYPRYLFYDAADAAGLATIFIYPEPAAGLTLYINSLKQLQAFSTISDTLVLPPGYQRAIEFNFAVEVAGGFTKVSPEVAKTAKESKAAVMKINLPTSVLGLDAGLVGRRSGANILTGP